MEVIFLVSLLQTSNKYKSTAIFVLPTFRFHFIVWFSQYLYPQVQSFISESECKAACHFSQNTQGSFAAPAPGTQSTFVHSRQNQVCLGTQHESTQCTLAHLAELCTLTNWKLVDIHTRTHKQADKSFSGVWHVQNWQPQRLPVLEL